MLIAGPAGSGSWLVCRPPKSPFTSGAAVTRKAPTPKGVAPGLSWACRLHSFTKEGARAPRMALVLEELRPVAVHKPPRIAVGIMGVLLVLRECLTFIQSSHRPGLVLSFQQW